jgi:ankyrin repeat protein
MTPLMLAIKEAHPVVVETLLDRKPDLDVRDYTGRGALGWAREGRDRRIERMLRRAGARD